MMNMTKKAALPMAIAAGLGLSMTASAATIASFEDQKVAAEELDTSQQEDVSLGNTPVINIDGFNPSSLTLSASNANIRTAANSYALGVVDENGDLVGLVTNEDEEIVVGDAVNGNMIFETGVGGMKVAIDGNAELDDLDNSRDLVVVDIDLSGEGDPPVAPQDGTPEFSTADGSFNTTTPDIQDLRLRLQEGLEIGSTIELTVEESGQSESASRQVLEVTPQYAFELNESVEAIIDVNTQRLEFAGTEGSNTATEAIGEVGIVDLDASGDLSGRFVTLASPLTVNGEDVAVTVAADAGDQAVETFELGGNEVPFDSDSGAWVAPTVSHPDGAATLALNFTVSGEEAIQGRSFNASAVFDQGPDGLEISYLDDTDIGAWELNGHQAFVPSFPTGNVAAQLRVVNQSTQEEPAEVTIDAFGPDGTQVLDNHVAGTVGAGSTLTLFRSDIVDAIGESLDAPVSMQITTNAPQSQVMVQGNVIVPNQGSSSLDVYNGADANQRFK